MSASVYERDARRIGDAINAMRARDLDGREIYDYSRSLVDVDLRRREVYSYGRHFPLFRYVPRDRRRRELFIINGDASPRSGRGWGGSRTPDHQADSRRLISATGADSCVIPFSALTGAAIDIDSVRPVHVRADHHWSETVSVQSLEDVPRWRQSHRAYTVESGPDGTRWYWTEHHHRLGDCLFSAVRAGRPRALFLSSFDYQERAPLYFLAQLPRGSGAVTVDMALDALAPRAVHAARARGLAVERQGDIFFIRTDLDLAELEVRGVASRARLTQWTRDARARKGEVGYSAPLDARGRRRMAAYRRAEWFRITREARTKLEHREAPAAGPKTEAGARRKWAKIRASDARDLELARAAMRAAIFGRLSRCRSSYSATRYAAPSSYGPAAIARERAGIAANVREARESLERVEARAAANARGRATARDRYRAPFSAGPAARVAWSMAGAAAAARFIPAEYHGPTIERRREKVRRALSVYGTAHSATEVVRTRAGAVYVSGTVRHVPALERGRTGRPDHAPLELGAGYWLAVRNTVPRADSRRRA